MNEVVTPAQTDNVVDVVEPVSSSAGTLLRNAREAAGLHVAALAVSMKVPVKKLEALEADRLDLLPDAVFVRALASSVCRTLKIDPAPILQKLPQTSIPRLDTEERGINAPFHTPGQESGLTVPAFLAKPAVLAVLALLLGVVVVVFFPETPKPERASEALSVPNVTSSSKAAVEEVFAPAEVGASAVPAVAVAPPAVVSVAPPVQQPLTAAATDASKVVVVSSPPVNKVDVPATASAEVSGTSSGVVVFKVRGPSWVEVTDSKGVVQLRKTLAAGETVGASGALPLSVVVGRVDVTDVDIRGKTFSMAAIAKDNVARFEVK